MIRAAMDKRLEHTRKSHVTIFIIGILTGCVCRLLDYVPADTLWSFSSIQTLFGFWIITYTIIVLLSSSNICAGISSFLYMFGMTLSFYGLQAILGIFIPLFSGGFRFSLFVMFTVLSIPCAIAAAIYLTKYYTFLFRLLMDSVGVIIFGILFFRRVMKIVLGLGGERSGIAGFGYCK